MNNKIDGLRSLVANESLPLAERKDAAAYVIRLMVEAIPVPSADDPEVVRLQQPHPRNTDLEIFTADIADQILGYHFTGNSLNEAQRMVHKRHQTRAVLAVIVDESAHRLERLAACQTILDVSHPEGAWRRNNYSAERLLEQIEVRSRVKSNGGFEYYKADPPKGARPPMGLSDVWDV